MVKQVKSSDLPWQPCKFNPGVTIVSQIKTVEGILVGDTIVCIIPPWPTITRTQREALLKAFTGGKIVYIETKVGYELTGRFFDPKDLEK